MTSRAWAQPTTQRLAVLSVCMARVSEVLCVRDGGRSAPPPHLCHLSGSSTKNRSSWRLVLS